MTGIAVLGSTGSIGRQALEVIDGLAGHAEVRAIAAGHPSDELTQQAARYPGSRVWCPGERPADIGRGRWSEGLEQLATLEGIEIVVVATTGMAALPAVLAALRSGRRVALANKETLVTGGHLVAAALENGGDLARRLDRLRPIDSEHSAIWQCLLGERIEDVDRLILTASGGPFRGRDSEEIASATPEEALAHPTWRMGPKITIDSATLVNKAFEAIEAKWLYGVPYPRIEAVIHPQSVVHSLVEFADGSFKAQLGTPDMRLPIQYALTYPRRLPPVGRHDSPTAWPALEFAPLDRGTYPAYDIVRAAAEAGGNRGVVLNAADEVAVAAFLDGRIGFGEIASTIERAVDRFGTDAEPGLDEIAAVDAGVRAALAVDIGLQTAS
jgi:1-deoxy-D-xylulose-5-phosphate reductoisomerase